MLAEHWGFPPGLCRAIREHHEPIEAEDAPPLRDCVFLANHLARQLEAAEFAETEGGIITTPFDPPPDFTLVRFQLSLDEIVAQLTGLDEELERVRNLS